MTPCFDVKLDEAASAQALERLNQSVADLRAITLQPLLRRATAALAAEDHKTAGELATKVLNRDARNGVAWHILAFAREKADDFKGAITCYESALALLPNQADVCHGLGRLSLRLGQPQTAAKFLAIYREAYPDCINGSNDLACALRDSHDYEGAIEVLKPAIMAHAGSAALWSTLGTVLGEQGRSAEAIVFYEEALRVEPGMARARYNLANARMDLGDFEGALADCDEAIRVATSPSDLAMMRLARSMMLLCQGHVGQGWDEYETRFDPHFASFTHFLIDKPRWSPDEDLQGKSLLLVGEQGLGDEVAFANMVEDILNDLGADGRLTIAVEPRLTPLFRRSFPTAVIVPHVTANVDGHNVRAVPSVDQEGIDLWTPMATPLRRFRRSASAFPDRPRFLTPDPERVAYWQGMVEALPGPKIGLLWKSLKLDGARLKSFSPFEQWRSVLEVQGASFVNLQYGDCQAELEQARTEFGIEIWQPPGIDLKDDLDDVAALCCAMDLILAPSNATANIAAACGAPLWMVGTPAAWPLLGTTRHPWYPQARVFLPKTHQHWDELMREMANALADEIPRMGRRVT